MGAARGAPAPQRRPEGSGDEVPGWAGRVMSALGALTHVVEVNVLVLLGTVAGGVLTGLPAALSAGGRLLADLTDGRRSDRPWHDFWVAWRRDWRRSTVLAVPFWLVGALCWLDSALLRAMTGPVRGALTAGLVVVVAWASVALAALPVLVRRSDQPAGPTWRRLALLPGLVPGPSLAVLVTVAAFVVVGTVLPVTVPLVGVAGPLLATGWLLEHGLEDLESRAGR